MDVCMECHFERELIREMGTQHCLSCHPFLSGGNESELRPTEESCKDCHSDRETKIALSEYHVTSECTTCRASFYPRYLMPKQRSMRVRGWKKT